MEKNYAKKQRGITLIALVVTIVILLILSGTKRLPACQRHRHIIKVSSICAVKLFRL